MLQSLLPQASARLREMRVIAGFDGFTDRILRPISKTDGDTLEYFSSIAEFGAFLQGKQGKSCSIELDVQTTKIGGNLPIFAAQLGTCGVEVDCIGMLEHPLFRAMPQSCRLFSYAQTATADCLEFDDGKIMLAARCTMADDPYERIAAAVPALAARYRDASLTALLNWSELAYAPALWQAVYTRCFAPLACDKGKSILFDLCDIARKDESAIRTVLTLMAQFSTVRHTVLSLNENECLLVGAAMGYAVHSPRDILSMLTLDFPIDEIIVHTLHKSMVLNAGVFYEKPTHFCEKPRISTGAGDHFNAGYALGLLLTSDIDQRIELANLVASYYITTGTDATLQALSGYAP